MNDSNARSFIENLFTSYVSILRRNGLFCVIRENQGIAVKHVLAAIRPQLLELKIVSDLQITKSKFKEGFKGFMNHSVTVPDAFPLLDIGRSSMHRNGGKRSTETAYDGSMSTRKEVKENSKSSNSDQKKEAICLYGLQR